MNLVFLAVALYADSVSQEPIIRGRSLVRYFAIYCKGSLVCLRLGLLMIVILRCLHGCSSRFL